MTAVFKPPYGSAGQHVISPAQNFGYHHLVAYLVDCGMYADHIRAVCADFYEARLPKDTITQAPDGRWMRRADLTNRAVGARLDSYAAALTKYTADLKAQRPR